MNCETITIEEVRRIHEALVEDFSQSSDPISPPGVRSDDLLGSAVSRQHTRIGHSLKYPDPVSNAATLLYGICLDHPFHNGNKRTSLVAMLVHLDKNRLVLANTREKDLYSMIMAVATHEIALSPGEVVRSGDSDKQRPTMDQDIIAISRWIGRRAKHILRGEKQITYKQLTKTLERFGYSLQNPKKNTIDIVKIETISKGLIRKTTETVYKGIGNIPYPGENEIVPIRYIKYTRRVCHLTEEDGYDTNTFYDEYEAVDAFINRYRNVLQRLANK